MSRVAGSEPAQIIDQSNTLEFSGPISGQEAAWRRARARRARWATSLLLCWLAVSLNAFAQSSKPAQNKPAPATETPKPAPTAQIIPRVTTTVVVHGETPDDYLPDTVTVGTLDGVPLKETPLSATVMTRDLLHDQVSRLLSDVVKNDASIGDDYVPVGYYGVYEIRGFPIDLATGLEINGMTIAGEQDVPLENKERVEFLKGIAGVESGVASAGGLIDYVTKRPAMVKAVDLATDQRGSTLTERSILGRSIRQPEAGGRARESGRRKNRELYERYQRLARDGRGRGGLEDHSEGDFEGRLRVPAQGGARRQRLPVAGRHDGAGHQPNLPIDDAGRPALGSARHLRHIQYRRAVGLRSAASVEGLRRGQLQPFAHTR